MLLTYYFHELVFDVLPVFLIQKEDRITILGKGNKERVIYLNEVTQFALQDYLEHRPDFDTDSLFVSQKRNPMSNRAIQYRVEFYLKKAGLDPKKYSPHKLRHTAATLLYKYDEVDIRALKEILGHESIATTQIYTHVDEETIRDAISKNPLNK